MAINQGSRVCSIRMAGMEYDHAGGDVFNVEELGKGNGVL